MRVKQLCTKNPTRSITTSPPLGKLVPRQNIVHRRPLLPAWLCRKKGEYPRYQDIGEHLCIHRCFEPMNRTAASNETETLWHVGRGSSPWPLDPDAVNFILCSRRRGTTSSAVICAPNYKTTNTTIAADKIATRGGEGGNRPPPDTNLVGSRDPRDDRATSPLTPPVGATLRWRKGRGKLFRRGAFLIVRCKHPIGNPKRKI
jgi:hypothetical protein